MSPATLAEQPKNPEYQLREKPWIVVAKASVVWLMTLLALGIGAQAVQAGTAEIPHYVAFGFGVLFLLVGCSPWPYRASLLVAVDQGFLYVMTRDLRSCVCVPLTRLSHAEAKKVSVHQGSHAWTLELELGTDPDDKGLASIATDRPGRFLISNGGHSRAGLEACVRKLSHFADAARAKA